MTTSTPPATIPPGQGPIWHTLSIEDALRAQSVDAATGLSQSEVNARLKQFGPNKFAEAEKVPGYIAFLNQYKDPMQIVLLVAAIVSIIIQQWSTALILIILTLFNAFLALRQEGKAEASVAALQKMLIVKSKVRRGGQIMELAAEQLVPGDIVVLEAGDRVPADGKIIRAATLEIDESALTGESAPVPKQIEPVEQVDTPLGDRVDMAYMNTEVTRGAADILVIATGMSTEVGHISGMLQSTGIEETPLTKQLNTLTRQIVAIALVALIFYIAIGYFTQWPDGERALTGRHRVRHRVDPYCPASGGHLLTGPGYNGPGNSRSDCQAAALGGNVRRDLGHQLGQDRHAHPQPDDGC